MSKPSKVIGVLGGMGPYATIIFQKNVFDLTPAKKEWNHLHLVVDVNTEIPGRTRALLYNETSPFSSMLESCKKLAEYPVDMIAVTCNNAHYWIKDVRKEFKIPIITPVDAVGVKIEPNERILVLGGYVTYEMDLYKEVIESKGSKYIKFEPDLQKNVLDIIEDLKICKPDKAKFEKLYDDIKHLNIDTVVLGCTEIESSWDFPVKVLDSNLELAKYVINFAKKK